MDTGVGAECTISTLGWGQRVHYRSWGGKRGGQHSPLGAQPINRVHNHKFGSFLADKAFSQQIMYGQSC
jgi:hypothetical protein